MGKLIKFQRLMQVLAGAAIALVLAVSGVAADDASPQVTKRPEDPRAAKAFSILEARCSSCHQNGALKRPNAAGNFSSVLDLGKLVRTPSLISPGFPEASRLYDILLWQHTSEIPANELPNADDIEVISDWIASLPPDDGKRDVSSTAPVPLVDFATAAAELGLSLTELEEKLLAVDGPWKRVARRLLYGFISRADAGQLYMLIMPVGGGTPHIDQPTHDASSPALDLWIEPAAVAPGQTLAINAATDRACHLTVINIDAAGKGVVVFPNDFEQDNLVPTGKVVQIPDPESAYVIRYTGDGPETLMALCSLSSKPPLGIKHDFERLRFTIPGNWKNFVRESIIQDRAARSSAPLAEPLRRVIVIGGAK